MSFRKRLFYLVVLMLIFFWHYSEPVEAYYTNMPASIVLGQPNFTSNTQRYGGVSAYSYARPYSVHFDGTHLYVSDFGNHRIMVYNSLPSANYAAADVVIGQTNFTDSNVNQGGTAAANTLKYPGPVVRAGNKLLVSDAYNYRVLIYNQVPTSNNASADVVIGQPDFTTAISGVTQTKYAFPWGLDYDQSSGKLIVTDLNNSRILIYNQVPTSNNASADVVVGQPDFVTSSTGVTASKLSGPYTAKIINSKLIVSDLDNNRVLIWNSIPTSNGQAADVVIGQPDFVSNSANQGGTVSANTLYYPSDIESDGKRLFIFDCNNSRVLIFNEIPTSNNASADVVVGQPDFVSRGINQGRSVAANTLSGYANPLYNDGGMDLYGNKLFVADVSNYRVLIYDNIVSTPAMGIDSETEKLSGGLMRLKGNIQLGERDRYALQWVKASVNGEGYSQVTNLGGGRDDGPGITIYDFYHDFEPWAGSNGARADWVANSSAMEDSLGYTVALKAQSLNVDEQNAFYFKPFVLKEFSSDTTTRNPVFEFSVNKEKQSELRNNLSHYQIMAKKDGASWEKFIDSIPITPDSVLSSSFENSDFIATYSESSSNIQVQKKWSGLSGGDYQFKVEAVNKNGSTQESNIISGTLKGSAYNPLGFMPTLSWFPLQVNYISGTKASYLSNFNPGYAKTYYSAYQIPTFSGIAFSGSIVALNVTDIKTDKARTYTTTAINSKWSLSPTLFDNSIIDLSVYDQAGHYTELLPFTIFLSSQ